jgi:hypothetical protein
MWPASHGASGPEELTVRTFGRGLLAPVRRCLVGLGVALDVKPCVSRSAAECAVGSPRCFLQHRRGSRKDGDDLWAGLERVRPILVWCRCFRFVHWAILSNLVVGACCAFRVASRCRPRHRPDAPYFRRNSAGMHRFATAATFGRGRPMPLGRQRMSQRRVVITFCHRSEIGHQRCHCWASPSARAAFGWPSGSSRTTCVLRLVRTSVRRAMTSRGSVVRAFV